MQDLKYNEKREKEELECICLIKSSIGCIDPQFK